MDDELFWWVQKYIWVILSVLTCISFIFVFQFYSSCRGVCSVFFLFLDNKIEACPIITICVGRRFGLGRPQTFLPLLLYDFIYQMIEMVLQKISVWCESIRGKWPPNDKCVFWWQLNPLWAQSLFLWSLLSCWESCASCFSWPWNYLTHHADNSREYKGFWHIYFSSSSAKKIF